MKVKVNVYPFHENPGEKVSKFFCKTEDEEIIAVLTNDDATRYELRQAVKNGDGLEVPVIIRQDTLFVNYHKA